MILLLSVLMQTAQGQNVNIKHDTVQIKDPTTNQSSEIPNSAHGYILWSIAPFDILISVVVIVLIITSMRRPNPVKEKTIYTLSDHIQGYILTEIKRQIDAKDNTPVFPPAKSLSNTEKEHSENILFTPGPEEDAILK
jgi:hypothetical protein